MIEDPQVLRPFSVAERITTADAAKFAGRTVQTIRLWCANHHIGRRHGSEWLVSIVALDLYCSGEDDALKRYLKGDRQDAKVVAAFERHGVPILRSQCKQRENGGVPLGTATA
jgi:hypothetical protein